MQNWQLLRLAMAKVDLRGVAKVTSKGRVYYYAWRGGPRLSGAPGSPEFIASYATALESRRTSDNGSVRALVANYRSSPAFTGLAETTRKVWTLWLDRIVERFGDYRVGLFDHPEKMRPIIRKWRDKWQASPRSADYAIQVLSRVMTHAVDLDKIRSNPCEGIKKLYQSNRAEIIWTAEDLAKLEAVASPEVWWCVNLAAHTGLRAGDLKRLCWSHVGENEIIIPTSKSGEATSAFVPLYRALRDVLASIPKRAPTVLTNEKVRPWKDGVNGTSFRDAREKALPGRDLHFHDLRGTAATRFKAAGLDNREIAELMGWEEATVEKIIRRYVGRRAHVDAVIRKLNLGEA
jgi:integrase